MRRLAIIAALSVAAGVAGGQNVIIVDAANGPGTNFVDLPTAVAAAASGDRLIVRPGSYLPFYVSGKALRISGASPAQTQISGPHNAALGLDYVKIEAVPAGETFRLESIWVKGSFPLPTGLGSSLMSRLALSGPTGSFVVSDVNVSPPTPGGNHNGGGLRVENGAHVYASRSAFFGGFVAFTFVGPFPPNPSIVVGVGGEGGKVESGGVLIADECSFVGASSIASNSSAAYGGHGLIVSGADVRAFAGVCHGGWAAAFGSPNGSANPGRGVSILGASTMRAFGAASINGGNGTVVALPVTYAPAIACTSPAIVDVHQPVVLAPNGGAPTTGTGTVNLGLLHLPVVACVGTPLGVGALNAAQPATITLSNPALPGSLFALFLSVGPGFSVPFPTLMLNESLLADLNFPAIVGTTDAFGAFSFSFTAAALFPGALDVPLHMQGAVIDAAQNLALMSNATVRVFK